MKIFNKTENIEKWKGVFVLCLANKKLENTLINAKGATFGNKVGNAYVSMSTYDISIITGSNKAVVGVDGLDVTQGGTNVAHFGSVSRVGDAANEHVSMSSAGFFIKDGNTQLGKFVAKGATLGVTSGAHISASTTDVNIIKDSNNYTQISSSGMSVFAGGNQVAKFGAVSTIGRDGEARTTISDTTLSMYSGQSTPYKRVELDNDGRAAFGGAAGADVSTTSTDDVVRITPGAGVAIYEDSNNYASMSSAGMKLYQGGNNVATFAATSIIGSSTDKVTISDSGIIIRENNVDSIVMQNGRITLYGGGTDDSLIININKIKKGIFIGVGEWGKANIISQKKSKKRALVLLELHHGKNREIRRLFHAIDHKLFSLKRIQYAGLDLGSLPLGQYRSLDHSELRKIHSFTK